MAPTPANCTAKCSTCIPVAASESSAWACCLKKWEPSSTPQSTRGCVNSPDVKVRSWETTPHSNHNLNRANRATPRNGLLRSLALERRLFRAAQTKTQVEPRTPHLDERLER